MKMLPWILIGVAALFAMATNSHIEILKWFIPSVEGFSSVPVWDNKQWSWGYGTAAGYDHNVKPSGTITREKAFHDSLMVFAQAYKYLSPHVKRNLNAKQWAALLSFSYNEGPGNAMHIVDTINSGTAADVIARMKLYIYDNGVKSDGLIARRKKETDLYLGLI